jgi:hypothetical protein
MATPPSTIKPPSTYRKILKWITCSQCGTSEDRPERLLYASPPDVARFLASPPVNFRGAEYRVYDASQPAIGVRSGSPTEVVLPSTSPVASQADAYVSGPGSPINHGASDWIHHTGEDQGSFYPNGSSGAQQPECVPEPLVTPIDSDDEPSVAFEDPPNTRQVSNPSDETSVQPLPTPIDYSLSFHTPPTSCPAELAPEVDGQEDSGHASPPAHKCGHNDREFPDEVSSMRHFEYSL